MPSPRDGYISLDDFSSLILNKYPAGSFDAWERDDILRYILQKNPSFTDYLNDQDLKFLFPQLKSEGEKLYETIGSDAAQGFWGRVGSGVAEGARNVASAGMDILGDEGKTRRYFREQAQERLKDNVELQALYAWHEDEPTTFKNVADVWNTDVFSRALSEGLPSILTMWGGSSAANLITRGARGAFGKTMAGAAATQAARQAAKLSSYGIMAALEGSSNYVNSMNILTDQGYSEEEAREYAALPALGYSMVAGWLETTPWMYFVNRFSPAGVENRLLQSLTMGFMNKGVTKSNAPGIFGKQWGVAKATSILDQALLEGATEWSQAELDMMITNVMKNPNVPAKTPDQVAKYMYEDFLNAFSSWEAAGEQFWSDEIREQAIAGIVTGGTFGSSPMGRSWASIGLTEEERKEAAAEGVELADAEVIEEGEVHVEGAPVGDVEVVEEGDLSAKDFLTSLVTGSPITVSPSEVKSDETQPVMTAVSQAKKGRTFEEQVVDYARNRGADFIDDLDAMEDGDKRRLLNNVGKWMQDKNILDKGGVNVDDVATLLDMHSTGKITIEEETVRGEKGDVLSTKSILNISEDATESEQQEVVGIARRSIQSDTKGRRRKRPEDEVQGRLEALNIENLRVAREQERAEEKRSREERKKRPKKERQQRPQPQRERPRPQPERPRPSTKERIKQKKEGDKIKEKVVVGQSAKVKSGKLSQHHELAGAAVTILDKMKGVAKVAGIATKGKKKGKRIERLIPYHELEGFGEVSPKGEGSRVQITFGANKGKLGTILTIDSKNKKAKIRTDDGKTSVLSFKKKGSKFVAAEQVTEEKQPSVTVPTKVTRKKIISRKDVRSNPDVQYLFGDNLQHRGRGGQAKQMRGEPNTIGIPTKKRPSMAKNAFFTDKEYDKNVKAIDKAFSKIDMSKPIVIPSDGIGTGMAELKSKAPKTFEYLQARIRDLEKGVIAGGETSPEISGQTETAPFPTELGTPNVGKVRRLQKARGEQSKLKKGFKWIGISSRTKEGPVALRAQGKDVTNLVESAPPGTSWVLHKTPGEKGWSVTNEQSGLAVGQNSRTQKEAINRANEILNKGMRDKPGGVGIFQETMRSEEVSKFREDVGLKPLPKAPAKPKKEAAPKKKKKKEEKKAPLEQLTDLPTLYNMLKSDNPKIVKVAKEQLDKMGEEVPGERVSRRERKKKSGRGKRIPLDAHDKKVAERKKKLKQWLPTASDIRSIPRKLGQLQSSPAFRKKIIARLKKRMPFVRNMSAKQLDKLLKESPNSLGFALGEMVGIPDGAPIESYPHEYFHIYWSMIQDTPFVKKAVNLFKKDAYASLEKPVTPAGIKTKDFRTMTERKKEAAVQGDKSAQAEWAVEEVSEFYSAVEDGNISEIREEAMGLLRLAQHWPDNADVRLTVRKVIKDINKVFPTKESFNEAFDKWKAAKIKKGQAQEGVYVEDLKKTLEEIGKGIFKEKSTPLIDIFEDAGTMTQEELDTAVVEEYLARQVANVYITMASESLPAKAARWIKRFYRKLKNMFRTTKFNKNDVIDIFAEELYGTDPLYSVPQSAQGKLKRWAASINNEQGEGFDESLTEDPEDEQDETLGEDASPADFVFKRFEESTQKLFGAPLLNSEVATLIHKARELEVDVGSIKGMKQFLTYIRAAGFAQNTNRKVMFLADFEGKQKKKKTLNRKERNAFIRFYNHANDTIRRSTKVFLQSVDGDVQLKSSEKDFMGNTQSEFINKSFIDDLDVGEDTVMMLGSDVFAETRYSKWRNFEDPQYGPDFLNFEDVEFLEDQLSYFESEKGSPRPMALLGIKGADKNAFMIVRVGNQFRYKNGALWKDKKVVEYFRDEIAAGRMTEQHLKDIEESALTRAEENDFVLLQAAARHNWWKSVMGNNYLIEDDMQTRGVKDYFNRTRIPFNEGSTPRGLGDTRVMVMDMDTIEIEYEDANGNVVRRDPKEDYTETGEPRYFGDGFLGVNDRIISGVEEATGRKPEANEYPLSEFKPSFYHITEDKESVLAIKANASKPPPGLRFLDKATGRLVMETREDENGQMHFYDGNGVEFDMFATKDEAKRNTGQFDVTNEVFDYNFPETSMKVIFGSSPKGKPSAAHPLSWYEMFIAPDLMKDPDVAKALELAGFHILDIMQENIITLIKGRWNPSFLKRNLKRMGILDSYGSLKEGKIVNRIKAGALRHSAFLGRYRSSLGNMLIKKTAFKGRRTGQGTLFTIYPDWKNEVAEDEIIVGDMNEVTIKRVADKVIGKKDRSASKKERGIREEWDALYKNKETRDDAVNQLNAVLAVEDIKTLVHRQPIPDVGSPRILRIKEIRIGLGNVAIPNSKVLYNIMQGDNDGDHLALEFLPDKLTNALEKAVNSKAFKNRKKSIKLGIFKHDTHTGNLANFDDIKKFTSMVSVGQFAQGISVNAKNIRELLSYKDIVVGLTDKGKTAHLENAKLAFLPSNSNVIMDYAPLDIDVLTADGGIVMKQLMENDKVKIITSDGKFIKTPEELLKFAGRETSMPSRISSAKAPQAIAKFFTPIHDSIKGKMTVSAYMKMHGPRTLTGKVEFLRNENKPNEFLLLETTSEGTRAFGYVSDKKASLMGRQDMYGFKLNNIYQQGEVYGLVGKEYIEKNYGLTWEGTIGGDERPFVTSVTEETGENEVYLYTTSAHEMATILQASVDNAKELLLYGWGWGNEDLYGKSGYNFLFSRMIADKRNIRKMKDGSWKDADSPKGAPSVTKSLLKEEGALTMMRHVFNFFNYSQFRQGRDKNRRSLGLQEIGRRSFDKANFIASTPEEKGARVKRHMFTSDKRLKKLVKSVTMNNRFTSLEQGFAKYFKLAREQIKNHGEEGEVLNWDVTRYNHTRLKNAFIFARDSINANFAHLVDKYKVPIAEGDLEAAKKFAKLMHTRFYNIGKDKMYIAEDGTEYDATEDRVVRNEYSKMMGAFIEDHIHQFLALSPGAQFLHTHMFLNALERSDVRINKRGGVSAMITDAADKLLPWELMDEDLSIEYLDAWSDGLDASSNTEERVAQEKWKDTRVDIAQDKYEIDNGCRVASK